MCDEPLYELNIAKHEALGRLLGMVDVVMLAEVHPTVFTMLDVLTGLREARDGYNLADAAYRDARLAQ